MATVPTRKSKREVEYPTSDGKPMAETDLHRDEMIDSIQVLSDFFAERPRVYVSGNLLLYYEEGNPRKHVSPDLLVAIDVPKLPRRDYYLVWKEGKSPDFVAEITSKTTRREDQHKKLVIYRDILKVTEYVLFDPRSEYLKPSLQGFRLVQGDYLPIELVDGRLPSEVLGLHLERDGLELRFYDPATGTRLLTPREGRQAAERVAEEKRQLAEAQTRLAEEERRRAEAADATARQLAEENERLQREIERLRGGK